MDKAFVKYLYERGGNPRGVTDLVDSVFMEKKGRCSRPREIPMYHIAVPCSEGIREHYASKDKEDSGV